MSEPLTFPIPTRTPINVLWADPLSLLGATIDSCPQDLRPIRDLCLAFTRYYDRLNLKLQFWMLGALTQTELEGLIAKAGFSDHSWSILSEVMQRFELRNGVNAGQWERLKEGVLAQARSGATTWEALQELHLANYEDQNPWRARLNRAGLPGSLDARDIFIHEMPDEFLKFMYQPAPSEASALGATMFEVCLALPNIGRPTEELVKLRKEIEHQIGPLPLMLTLEQCETLRGY